ncbi:unnamed protein product [Microthlaspi erraticum]|uniref:Uncharacterized protein n=1 Tax=Microthlaspi erraticum TaxID=1685480 RepID=A0A6D2JGL2_9BRAS|nr:unnamed protein product [Microthlaspi erraticum]
MSLRLRLCLPPDLSPPSRTSAKNRGSSLRRRMSAPSRYVSASTILPHPISSRRRWHWCSSSSPSPQPGPVKPLLNPPNPNNGKLEVGKKDGFGRKVQEILCGFL